MKDYKKTRSSNVTKWLEFICMIGSLAATAAINYTLFHTSFVFIVLLVLLAHELGHYFMAHLHKAKPSLPIFIPLPFILIAITKVLDADFDATQRIALAGPLAALITIVVLMIASITLEYLMLPLIPLLILLITEFVFNTIGSDGKRYRSARNQARMA